MDRHSGTPHGGKNGPGVVDEIRAVIGVLKFVAEVSSGVIVEPNADPKTVVEVNVGYGAAGEWAILCSHLQEARRRR